MFCVVPGICSFPPSGVCTDVLLDWKDRYEKDLEHVALRHARAASVHLCLGTSLQIQPACHFPGKERRKGSSLIIVNLQATPLDKWSDICLRYPTDGVCSFLARGLGGIFSEEREKEAEGQRADDVVVKASSPTVEERGEDVGGGEGVVVVVGGQVLDGSKNGRNEEHRRRIEDGIHGEKNESLKEEETSKRREEERVVLGEDERGSRWRSGRRRKRVLAWMWERGGGRWGDVGMISPSDDDVSGGDSEDFDRTKSEWEGKEEEKEKEEFCEDKRKGTLSVGEERTDRQIPREKMLNGETVRGAEAVSLQAQQHRKEEERREEEKSKGGGEREEGGGGRRCKVGETFPFIRTTLVFILRVPVHSAPALALPILPPPRSHQEVFSSSTSWEKKSQPSTTGCPTPGCVTPRTLRTRRRQEGEEDEEGEQGGGKEKQRRVQKNKVKEAEVTCEDSKIERERELEEGGKEREDDAQERRKKNGQTTRSSPDPGPGEKKDRHQDENHVRTKESLYTGSSSPAVGDKNGLPCEDSVEDKPTFPSCDVGGNRSFSPSLLARQRFLLRISCGVRVEELSSSSPRVQEKGTFEREGRSRESLSGHHRHDFHGERECSRRVDHPNSDRAKISHVDTLRGLWCIDISQGRLRRRQATRSVAFSLFLSPMKDFSFRCQFPQSSSFNSLLWAESRRDFRLCLSSDEEERGR